MDTTPITHAVCAVIAQILVGLSTGNWAYGAIAGCTFFIAREHTQAEYRWIEKFGKGKRINMPWWGGFDPRVWDVGSLLDFLSQLSDAYWYGFLHRSEHIITDETKLRQTKLCTGLQGFVLFDSG